MVSLFLVEDERVPRESIRNNVPWKDHDIEFLGDASDGEVALPQILEKKPDILLTDIKMPFMDGLELAQVVRRRLPKTKIIFLSGYNEFDYARQAVSIGISEYLLKPVSSDDILTAVDKVRGQIERDKVVEQERADLVDGRREILFSNLFSGAMTNTSQILSSAEQLGINLSASAYQAIILYISPAITPSDPLRRAFYTAPGVLASGFTGEQIVYLVLGKDREEVDGKVNDLKQWVRDLEERFSLKTHFSPGKIVYRLREICETFRTARLYQNNWQEEEQKCSFAESGSFDSRAMLEFLRTGKESSVCSFWEGVRPALEKSFSSLIYRCYIYAEIFFVFNQYSKESGVELPEALRDEGIQQDYITSDDSVDNFLNFCCNICQQFIAEREKLNGARSGSAVDLAKEYVGQNYMDGELSLTTVASVVGLSPSHLSSVFKAKFGVGFNEYLTDIRIQQAQRLLVTTNMKTAEVGERVGYLNMNYFSILFKKITGLTPSQYRREHAT